MRSRTLALAATLVAATTWGMVEAGQQPPEPLVVFDGEFLESDWSVQATHVNGTTESHERRPTGGNADAFRYMRHDLPPSSVLSVVHTYEPYVYDPAQQGAVGGITASFDQIEFEPPFFNAAVGSLFVVRQGGNLWIAKPDLTYRHTDWRRAVAFCLQPSDFYPSGEQLPDFSASGAPMRFGVVRSNSNDSTTVPIAIQHGLDNFRVLVHGTDNPGCAGEPADVRVSKSDNRHRWSTDPVVAYTITVSNVGGSAAPVTLAELVPTNTRFRPAQSDPRWLCPSIDEGSRCTLAIDSLAPGTSEDVAFTVRVTNATPVFWGLFNEVFAGSDGGVVATDVTSPGPCDPGDPFSESLCGLLCTMYPAACAALEPEPLPAGATAAGASPRAAAGEPDATYDLAMLYRLRDRVLRGDRGGDRATQLWYAHRIDAARATFEDPSLIGLAEEVLVAWDDDLRALLDGDGGGAGVDAGEMAAVEAFLDALREAAPAALAEAIDRERPRLRLHEWAGLDMDDVLANLSRLTCEGYEEELFCGELTGDCAITANDALLALRIAVSQRPDQAEADMDKSGSVTANDALAILKQAVGILPPSTACN